MNKHPNAVDGSFSSVPPFRRKAAEVRYLARTAAVKMRKRRGGRRRVLLVARSAVMVDYAAVIGDLIVDSGLNVDMVWYLGSPDLVQMATERHDIPIAGRNAPWVHWDLKIFTDHCPLLFPATDGKSLLSSHGLVRSRVTPSGSYFYDRSRALYRGVPIYDVILAPSQRSAEFGLSILPEYADRISVAGDLRVDRLIELGKGRSRERPRVLMMSTWGAPSLMETIGETLVPDLVEVQTQGDFDVSITTHPNLWVERMSSHDWKPLLSYASAHGVQIIKPGTPWEEVLATADLVISDHTSLVANFLFLNRPVLLAPVPAGVVEEGTVFDQLREIAPTLDSRLPLVDQMNSALRSEMSETYSRLVDSEVDARGVSADLCLNAIRGLLDAG